MLFVRAAPINHNIFFNSDSLYNKLNILSNDGVGPGVGVYDNWVVE